jgi:hypothetical protein
MCSPSATLFGQCRRPPYSPGVAGPVSAAGALLRPTAQRRPARRAPPAHSDCNHAKPARPPCSTSPPNGPAALLARLLGIHISVAVARIVDGARCFSAVSDSVPLIHERRTRTTGNSLVNKRNLRVSRSRASLVSCRKPRAVCWGPPAPCSIASARSPPPAAQPRHRRTQHVLRLPTQPAATQTLISDDGRIMHQTGSLDQLDGLERRFLGRFDERFKPPTIGEPLNPSPSDAIPESSDTSTCSPGPCARGRWTAAASCGRRPGPPRTSPARCARQRHV